MTKFFLTHGLCTARNKALLFLTEGDLQKESAEQNPLDWWQAACKRTNEAGREEVLCLEPETRQQYLSLKETFRESYRALISICGKLTHL